jgi:hypothetical protein
MTVPELYEDDLYWVTDSLSVRSGYLPLWRFDFSWKEPTNDPNPFIGPKYQSDSTNLIFADNLHYAKNEKWKSNHPLEQGMKGDWFHEFAIDDQPDPFKTLGRVKYNAGYKDGHVEPFTTEETVEQSQGNSIYYLPRKWR